MASETASASVWPGATVDGTLSARCDCGGAVLPQARSFRDPGLGAGAGVGVATGAVAWRLVSALLGTRPGVAPPARDRFSM
ncbi:hypothetical protein [Achromobacter xylosoxidans]|uniref:hypothetical protein n=1 Tax=Alcaligenes xylosoxydans xylosoxydans TaxID=85698 RepID=UPI001F138A26|nr:hypothetical protein [Achromobacter xylosoxidans]